MAENRYTKAAKAVMQKDSGGTDAPLQKKPKPNPHVGLGERASRGYDAMLGGSGAKGRAGRARGDVSSSGKTAGPNAFRVRGRKGDPDIRLPASVYQGPSVAALEDVTPHQGALQRGYIQRPGEKGYRTPVDDDTYQAIIGSGPLRGQSVGRSMGARLEEGQSFPEDISERDKMLENFPLPSYEEAGRMRGEIDVLFEEMIAAKESEKEDAWRASLKEKYGDLVGGAFGKLESVAPMPGLDRGALSFEEEDALFQEAGREYLRKRAASQEAMEDTPVG